MSHFLPNVIIFVYKRRQEPVFFTGLFYDEHSNRFDFQLLLDLRFDDEEEGIKHNKKKGALSLTQDCTCSGIICRY
jgi:hypothetical protein